jgi:hypothetical protein
MQLNIDHRKEDAPGHGRAAMECNEDARTVMTRRLIEAIELVRKDVAAVEIWAQAMTAFVQPIPSYEPRDVSPWLPREQATELRSTGAQHEL